MHFWLAGIIPEGETSFSTSGHPLLSKYPWASPWSGMDTAISSTSSGSTSSPGPQVVKYEPSLYEESEAAHVVI